MALGVTTVIRPFEGGDAVKAIMLWRSTEWASVSASDSPDEIAKFLQRNPECSWVAEDNGRLLGTVLCGHDARRGYIYHLVVDEDHRESGIGRQLLERALDSLRSVGILKCHAIVIDHNPAAEFFWSRLGWEMQGTSQYSVILERDDG